MRAVAVALAVVAAGAGVAVAQRVRLEWACGAGGQANHTTDRCDCPVGKHPELTEKGHAVCVVDPPAPARAPVQLAPPELGSPYDGMRNVHARTPFRVYAPSWADSLELEVCADAGCRGRRPIVRDLEIRDGVAAFQLETLQGPGELYWRVRGRRNGRSEGPYSHTWRFTLAPSKAEGALDLKKADALITLGKLADAVELGLGRSSTELYDLAALLGDKGHCGSALDVLKLARDKSDRKAEERLVDLEMRCIAGIANRRAKLDLDRGNHAGAEKAITEFLATYPDELKHVAWIWAYLLVKTEPLDCAAVEAKRQVALTGPDPQKVAADVAAVCPPPPKPEEPKVDPEPAPVGARDYINLFGMFTYTGALAGDATPRGPGISIGFTTNADSDVFRLGAALSAVRPFAGPSETHANYYGLGMRLEVTSSDRRKVAGGFVMHTAIGGGHFRSADRERGAFVMDLLAGGVLKIRLAGGLRLLTHAGLGAGFLIYGGEDHDEVLDRVTSAFRGTLSYSGGLAIDGVWSTTRPRKR